LKIKLSFFCLK